MHYFIVWCILSISCIITATPHKKIVSRLLMVVVYLAVALTSGLRYETGTDYFSYSGIYSDIYPLHIAIDQGKLFPINTLIEPSYLFICSLFAMLGLSVNIMFLAIALATTALLFNSIKNYIPKYFNFGVLLYFCFIYFLLDMSGIRQAIALNLFIFSIRYILTKNLFKFLLIILLAISFHYTAVILLLCYPLYNIKFSKTTMISIMAISFIILVLRLPWISFVIDLLGSTVNNELLSSKLLTYTSNEFLTKSRILSPVMLIYVPVFITAVLYRDKLSKTTPYYNILLNIFMFFIVSVFGLYESEDISVRMSSYFMISFCLLLPLTLELVEAGTSRSIVATSILILSLYSIRDMIYSDQVSSILFRPYQNYILIEAGIQHSDAQNRKDTFLNHFGD